MVAQHYPTHMELSERLDDAVAAADSSSPLHSADEDTLDSAVERLSETDEEGTRSKGRMGGFPSWSLKAPGTYSECPIYGCDRRMRFFAQICQLPIPRAGAGIITQCPQHRDFFHFVYDRE